MNYHFFTITIYVIQYLESQTYYIAIKMHQLVNKKSIGVFGCHPFNPNSSKEVPVLRNIITSFKDLVARLRYAEEKL